MSIDEPLLSNCPLETAEPSRNYARVPGYKKKYKKKTRKRRGKKRKMNGVEINTRAYVATRLLLRWDYLYAVTLKTKVFGDYNHARLEVSWITSTRGLLLRGYTGRQTYCNRRNFRTRKNFVLKRSRVFVRYKFSYLEGGVTYTGIRTRDLYATNFRTFSQKYEIYEIKSRTKISAITVG